MRACVWALHCRLQHALPALNENASRLRQDIEKLEQLIATFKSYQENLLAKAAKQNEAVAARGA